MHTKLSMFCERIMEAGWLAALILEPLFFNVYSSRVFEPDKLALLRSIALVMVATWIIKTIEEAGTNGRLGARAESSENSQGTQSPSLWQRIRRIPLAVPTLLLVAVYILFTITSVAPATSFWGSYQRLQGTYTTLSYIVIFALILSTLRRREQLERLILMAILTSLPIALYGLMQHYRLDPLPWGGDVAFRVASNMGNSIFVAAYMIMIVPLTLRNLIVALSSVLEGEPPEIKGVFIGGYILALLVQIVAWAKIGFAAGLLVGTVFTFITALFSISMRKPLVRFLWVGAYSVILVAQLVCIFFTQSRGPWLGLLGGVFFFVLTLAFARRIRWLQWNSNALAVVGGIFLIVLNMPGTPLEKIKDLPYVGRLGRIFETEMGTGKVRVLIWEGAVQLIGFHEPIGLPDQKDKLNAIRPLVGYGPESMYVAYNPFYPPELAYYERRNASPDRSHNETFDALVMTGLVGFLVYFFLFTSLFYYSLKWLGLIENKTHRNIFLGLGFGGAFLGTLIPLLLERSLKFVGVGLPFGFIIGVGLYLVVSSFMVSRQEGQEDGRQLLLIALLSAIVAHFIEIHFGIAIAATRTYFWAYAGVLVVVGMRWVSLEKMAPQAQLRGADSYSTAKGSPSRPAPKSSQTARRRRKSRAAAPVAQPIRPRTSAWRWAGILPYALLVGLIFITMSYDFITNQQGVTSTWEILSNSLTVLKRGGKEMRSYAMIWPFLFTWLLGGVLALTQVPGSDQADENRNSPNSSGQGDTNGNLAALGVYTMVPLAVFLLFALPHAASLQPGTDVARVIAPYYLAAFAMLFAVALALLGETPLPPVAFKPTARLGQAVMIPAAVAISAFLIYALNISIIKADIYYKQGKHYDNDRDWDKAIILYQESINYARGEDFYYLFLGRAYLEKASGIADANQRAPWLERARQILEEARRLNPLNTDHSANLARLYRTWAGMTSDPAKREQLLKRSLEYYNEATTLSPHNAQLFNEWGLVYVLRGEADEALEKYQISLSLDQKFEQTYLHLSNLYLNQKRYDEAAEASRRIIELKPENVQAHSALGYIYSQQGKLEEAVQENLEVLKIAPRDYASHKNLAILYQQLGLLPKALEEAKIALGSAPDNEKAALQNFISQLEQRTK